VIRTFDFVSSLRRMSVLVKKLKSQTVEVYVKGAPEALVEICDKDTRASADVRSVREAVCSLSVLQFPRTLTKFWPTTPGMATVLSPWLPRVFLA
jgi:magnesium-transporting ATPase (P-type)